MRIVFMGTPDFAAEIINALFRSSHEVVGAITRPDAVRGRGKKLISSPVKECALAEGVPVLEYASLRSDEAFAQLQALEPDVICVAAYGAILPKRVLDLPRFGCLNVHGSLLPRWRGAAPVERAILAGDAYTGIGIMRMEEGLDTGATALVREVSVDEKSADELSLELAKVGGAALVEVLDQLDSDGALTWTEQDETLGVTYAEKIEKGELDLQPSLAVEDVLRRVRASSDNHPCRCIITEKPVTVLAARSAGQLEHAPEEGRVAFLQKRFYLGCSDGVIELCEVKPDGKKAMPAQAFAAGIQGIKQNGASWSESYGS